MKKRGLFDVRWTIAPALMTVIALSASPVSAGTFSQLYDFTGGSDGAAPWGSLARDASGNLYGVNSQGGGICSDDTYYGCGVVYKMSPVGSVTSLHTFTGGSEGSSPETGVTISGNKMYGAAFGGSNDAGVLFSMNNDGSAFTIRHQFTGVDGYIPAGVLRLVAGSGLYGITQKGGPGFKDGKLGDGVLFFSRLSGQFAVVHNFAGGQDGRFPDDVVVSPSGDVFGSAITGGGSCSISGGCGVIFRYSPASNTYSIIYSFQNASDGRNPMLGGIDANGILYGAASGGEFNHGTLFSLTPQDGSYSFAVLATLKSSDQGDEPVIPPTLAGSGALLGATSTYIYAYRNGTVSVLATFGVNVPFLTPLGQFLLGHNSVVYGTSHDGGITPCPLITGHISPDGCGSIFSYKMP